MDYRIVLGLTATILGFIGYVPYIRDLIRGKTKPHIFTWLIWGVLTGIAFGAQVVEGAGPGSWVTGCTAAVCIFIAVAASKNGNKDITKTDWLCFIAAILGIVLWFLLKDPLLAIIVVTVTDALAFIPTFRKSYFSPFTENVSTYTLSSIKFAIGLLALQSLDVVNWMYPASLVLMNGIFVFLLLIRRQQIVASNPN